MEFQEVEWGGTDWIALTQDRDRWRALVNAVIDSNVYWTVHHCNS